MSIIKNIVSDLEEMHDVDGKKEIKSMLLMLHQSGDISDRELAAHLEELEEVYDKIIQQK